MKHFLSIAFLTPSLDRQLSTLQQNFTFGSFEIDMIQLIPTKAHISSGFVANSLLFCVAYRFVWLQTCFTSSFKFVVPSKITNGLALPGMSHNAFASSVHFFALKNLDMHFHFNSARFFIFQLVVHLYLRLHRQHGLLTVTVDIFCVKIF